MKLVLEFEDKFEIEREVVDWESLREERTVDEKEKEKEQEQDEDGDDQRIRSMIRWWLVLEESEKRKNYYQLKAHEHEVREYVVVQ
jgi:hypothetical protein